MQDKDGKTFLIHAIYLQKIPVVKQFLMMNASPHICEYKHNNSPLHLAVKINNKKIIDLLIENSANEKALNAHGKTPW